MKETYGVSARDYLQRACYRLSSDDPAALFYAAFELRCGIEARMKEYLDVWTHISNKKKKGWKIADIHRNLEQAFRTGDKIIRWSVLNPKSCELGICLYHTPVSADLRKDAQVIGNHLHSMKKFRAPSDEWWDNLRADLVLASNRLDSAVAGTLLGPPMTKDGTNEIDMKVEIPPHCSADEIMARMGGKGKEMTIKVAYLESLPDPAEPQAVLWRCKS